MCFHVALLKVEVEKVSNANAMCPHLSVFCSSFRQDTLWELRGGLLSLCGGPNFSPSTWCCSSSTCVWSSSTVSVSLSRENRAMLGKTLFTETCDPHLRSYPWILCWAVLLSRTSLWLLCSSSRDDTSSCSYTLACWSLTCLRRSTCLVRY